MNKTMDNLDLDYNNTIDYKYDDILNSRYNDNYDKYNHPATTLDLLMG